MMSVFDQQYMDRVWNRPWTILIAVLFLLAGPAQAEDLVLGEEALASSPMFEEEFDLGGLDGFAVAGEAELEESRGGEATAINLQDLQSTVEGNVVSGNVTTGSVNIGENAFSDFDGISSVVVNSGNNVSIQSSTVVNVIIGD